MFNKGQTHFKTKTGAFCSLIMFAVVFAFGIKRWIEMMHYENADLKITTLENFYNAEFQYDDAKQLSFAIGLVDN
jgi:hypothetical protein